MNQTIQPPILQTSNVGYRYNTTAIKSGDTIEILQYERPVYRRYNVYKKANGSTLTSRRERRKDNIQRAKSTLVRKVLCNAGTNTRFYTFTYATTMLDRETAVRDVAKMAKRYRKITGRDMKYVYTLERQKKRGKKEGNAGTWHVHMIVFDIGYYRNEFWQQAFWKQGYVKLTRTNNANHTARYIGKYITKEAKEVQAGKRLYTSSHDLDVPVTTHNPQTIGEWIQKANDSGFLFRVTGQRSHKYEDTTITYYRVEPPIKQKPLAGLLPDSFRSSMM